MIYKNINLFKSAILYEKLININVNKKNNIMINKLIISIKLPSNIKYVNGFITMLILLEKNTSNTPIFLKDINTLSKKRFIKIGLVISLSSELIEQYLQICLTHSIPKISKDDIIFNISIKNYNLFYNSNIILSNTIFSFDNALFLYYNYLTEFLYNIEIIFCINTKNILTNKLLMDLYNFNMTIEDQDVKNIYNNKIEINVMLELGDEEYSDFEDEISVLDELNILDEIDSISEDDELKYTLDEKKHKEKRIIINNMLEYILDYK